MTTKENQSSIKNEEYERIEELVKEYQQGSEGAANNLVAIFEPFLVKYLDMLSSNQTNLSNLDTRRFLKLFSDNEDYNNKIIKSKRSKEMQAMAYNKAKAVSKKVSHLEKDEIYNELVIILLMIAKKYNKVKKKVNFCGYLNSVFKYEVYRFVIKSGKDPLVFNETMCIDECEVHSYEDLSYEDEYNLLNKDSLLVAYDDELGINWLRGLDCSEAFENLTYTERYILKLYYVDKCSDEKVGEVIGVHRNTARQMRQEAIEKISIK